MTEQRTSEPTRAYRLGKRQDAMAATRLRIVQATLELHSTVGPAKTSIAAVADRAGVQRHTVYNHFPDLDSLFEACTLHGMESTGMPDGATWATVADPAARTRRGLRELIAWYRANRGMLDRVLADADPDASDADDPFSARMRELFTLLRDPWGPAPGAARVLDAVLAHALAYETWRSLTDARLSDREVLDLLVGWVSAAASPRQRPPSTRDAAR